jgi:hypothetical protein
MGFNSAFKGLTNFNKYLQYDTSETGVNINISANNYNEKLWINDTEIYEEYPTYNKKK